MNEIINTKDYNTFLSEIKEQIKTSQTRAIGSVNFEMILLYYKIGKALDQKQKNEGWGAKVIEKLSIDLKNEMPKLKGFSKRNMILMVQFYKEYKDIEIVQLPVAQLEKESPKQFLITQVSWSYNVTLMQKIKERKLRYWYIQKSLENGWSRDVLALMIKSELHKREAKLVLNFKSILPPNDRLAHKDDKPTIGLILCQEKDAVVAEYSLRNMSQPIGIAEYELTEILPKEFVSSLPTIEMIENEFAKIEE